MATAPPWEPSATHLRKPAAICTALGSCSAPRRCTETREQDQRKAEQNSSMHSFGSRFSATSRSARRTWRLAASMSAVEIPASPLKMLCLRCNWSKVLFSTKPWAMTSRDSSWMLQWLRTRSSNDEDPRPLPMQATAVSERALRERSRRLRLHPGRANCAKSGNATGIGWEGGAGTSSSPSAMRPSPSPAAAPAPSALGSAASAPKVFGAKPARRPSFGVDSTAGDGLTSADAASGSPSAASTLSASTSGSPRSATLLRA
mmetsp:Transcript_11133/g.24797  ORF Transcript_11133/g.24797 Transcript_11133/m.24797 type:complete len:260 (+) Transcript_11133:1536-2315(+)